MNWYAKVLKISGKPQMSYSEALDVFGLPSNARPSVEEIRSLYRKLALQNHPDKTGGDSRAFARINNANEVLMNSPAPARSRESKGDESRSRSQPAWQTDSRSSHNDVNKEVKDINWAKYTIYEYSNERGPTSRWEIYAHDGAYFRHGATFMTNKKSLEYAARVVAYWNSHGGSAYETRAVVASEENGDGTWTVVQVKGENVLDKNITFKCENSMPWNDRKANQFMYDLINGIDFTA